jgi:hypothetical protein
MVTDLEQYIVIDRNLVVITLVNLSIQFDLEYSAILDKNRLRYTTAPIA